MPKTYLKSEIWETECSGSALHSRIVNQCIQLYLKFCYGSMTNGTYAVNIDEAVFNKSLKK